jgi:hypothetical protein
MFLLESRKGPRTQTRIVSGSPTKLAALLATLFFIGCQTANDVPEIQTTGEEETDPAVLAKLEDFQDQKFGLFIHWGPCSQWGARIAWPLSKRAEWARPDDLQAWVERGKDFDRFSRDYVALNETFNPKAFEPEVWARAAEYAGMKYIVFVTKCHDGFSMFRTEQTSYSITDPSCPFHTNPRADITQSVLDAFRARGFRTGVYFSMPDWHHPDYEDGGQMRDFVYVRDCVELMLWMRDSPPPEGLYNVGSGRAQTWLELMSALYDAVDQPLEVEWVDTPVEIRDRYQYFTQADMGRLRDAGYTEPFRSVEHGVADYVQWHLATDDPYR